MMRSYGMHLIQSTGLQNETAAKKICSISTLQSLRAYKL